MKQIPFILIALFALSCSDPVKTDLDLINESISGHILNLAHDPESYEAMSTTIVDTVTIGEFVEFNKADLGEAVVRDKGYILSSEESILDIENILDYGEDEIMEELLGSTKETLLSFETSLAEDEAKLKQVEIEYPESTYDDIYQIHVTHQCRMNNAMGAKNLFSYYVSLDKDLKLKRIGEELEKIYPVYY